VHAKACGKLQGGLGLGGFMRTWITLAVVAILAGCLGDSNPTGTTTTTTSDAPKPQGFTVPNDASSCHEVVGLLLIDLARAQASLPPNWTAADAQGVLNAPQPTGRGVVWLNGYNCAEGANGPVSASEFGILVQAPRLSGNTTWNTTQFNLYEMIHFTDNADQLAMLAALNVTAAAANVTLPKDTRVPAGETGQVLVAAANATVFSFSYSALVPGTLEATATFWHENAEGLAATHFRIESVPTMHGFGSNCVFEHPRVREVAGSATCMPGQVAVVALPSQAWTSTFHWMPGVHAVA
jgi:hypothetical protein